MPKHDYVWLCAYVILGLYGHVLYVKGKIVFFHVMHELIKCEVYKPFLVDIMFVGQF